MRPECEADDRSGTAAGRRGTDPTADQTRVRRLVRHSHIFSSVVREILEYKLLRETFTAPLSIPQLHLLKLMAFNGQHQVGEIAELLGVSPPAASKNIDKLERLGLVVRAPSRTDRRATLLSVSDEGRRLVGEYELRKTECLVPVLAEFSCQEIEQLSGLLERFAVSLLTLEKPANEPCLRCAADFDEVNECAVARVFSVCPYRETRALHEAKTATKERP